MFKSMFKIRLKKNLFHRPFLLLVSGLVLAAGLGAGIASSDSFRLNCHGELQSVQGEREFQDEVQVALVPFKILGETPYEDFWEKFESKVMEAKSKGAEFIVFPELMGADLVEVTGEKRPLKEQMEEQAREVTPRFEADLKRLAKKEEISIVGGSFPRLEGGKIYNSAPIVLSTGEFIWQDKVFLTPDELKWGWSPGNEVKVIEAPWGRTLVLICYDAEFASISAALSRKYPELILVPSMTETEHGFRRVRWTSQARAIEHRAYVAIVGTVGVPDPYWPNYGRTVFLTPSEPGFPGVLSEGSLNSEDIHVESLDMKALRERRLQAGIYPACEEKGRLSRWFRRGVRAITVK